MAGASAGAADNLEEVVRCAFRKELASQSGRPGTKTEIISQSPNKPLVWKRNIDDIFSLWSTKREEIHVCSFIELANKYHLTIKFTAEISATEITFLDTCIYKGDRFKSESTLDVRTHLKPTEAFQTFQHMMYTHFSSCHCPGVKRSQERIH